MAPSRSRVCTYTADFGPVFGHFKITSTALAGIIFAAQAYMMTLCFCMTA